MNYTDENRRRNAEINALYDPVSGFGAYGPRVIRASPVTGEAAYIPVEMERDPQYEAAASDPVAWERLRVRYDFEFWAATCATISDKASRRDVKFRLNRAQRQVLEVLEGQRRAGKPIRLIILKARQWGCSTLIQLYMAWMQTVLLRNWHSIICAQQKETSHTIRAMYAKLLANYPAEVWGEECKPELKVFERSYNTRFIPGRDCRITVATAENPEAIRGADYAMAHLSEVAFWPETPSRSPEELVQGVASGILRQPLTLIVLESTANGVGSYFHREWIRAVRGDSDKTPVFVPWHRCDLYSEALDCDPEQFGASLSDYERRLWHDGCTLEQINWYRNTARQSQARGRMTAEFPSTDVEAFAHSGSPVFPPEMVDTLRRGCREPLARGELTADADKGFRALRGLRFARTDGGALEIWKWPDTADPRSDRYFVAVDIGGLSPASDMSVIAVLDRYSPEGAPEVVAQWRGHIDHDLLGWLSARIALWYNRAVVIFESNTLEQEAAGAKGSYILDELRDCYSNIYRRPGRHSETRLGFHTNTLTKTAMIETLRAAVRDGEIIERSDAACNELLTYECDERRNTYSARAGAHDDILMTRAMALYVARQYAAHPILSYTPLIRRNR